MLKNNGFSHRKIAESVGVSVGSISKTTQRVSETGGLLSRPRSGRPRVSTGRDDRQIVMEAKSSPRISVSRLRSKLPDHLQTLSKRTIRRRLFTAGLKACRPAKKPALSKKNVDDRLSFCKKYKNWSESDWDRVMFSDEATFTQFQNYSGHVWRPEKKRYDPKYLVPAVKL